MDYISTQILQQQQEELARRNKINDAIERLFLILHDKSYNPEMSM